jgi:hypothetical protein
MREESKRRHLSPINVENASLLRRSSRLDAKKASQNEESSFERRLSVEGTSQCRQNEDKTSQSRKNDEKTSQSLQNDEKTNTECRQNVTNNVEKMGRRKNVETMGRRQIEKRPEKRRQLRTMTTIHIRPDFAQRETVEVRV